MRKRFFGLELSHRRSESESHPYYYTNVYADPDGKAKRVFEAQTSIGGRHRWLGFHFGTSDMNGDFSLSVGLWFASVYTHFGGYKSRKNRELSLCYYPDAEGIGGDFGYFSWRVWTDPHSWRSSTPRWREGMWHIAESVFGQHRYSDELLGDTQTATVKMPEASYTVKCTPKRSMWTWPRFKKPMVKNYMEVEAESGIPVPGKGENSWDCGDDAIFSTAFETDSVEEAARLFGERAMQRRKKYANANWRPSTAA